jgi:DNA polymerase III delta subunit
MAASGIEIPPGEEDFRRLKRIVGPVMEAMTEKAALSVPGETDAAYLSGFYGGNPNRFMFLFSKAANFTGEELEAAVDLLERADLQIKSGRTRPAVVLEQTLIAICQK